MAADGGSLGPTGDAALGYARRGWAVFPIRPGEKRPACAHGCLDATTDEAQIHDWWGLQPDAGVGIACGAASGGLLVLDLDKGHGAGEADGEEWVQEWQADNGPLPETLAARTGGGGVHLFYRYEPVPGEKLRGSANPRLGVDIRADGGYVVAAPTLHDSGRRYAWETDREPAWADADVMALVEAVRPRAERSTGAEPATAGGSGWGPRQDDEYPGCAEGGRNVTLHKWLCSKRGGGADDAAIERMAFAANQRNVPPLADWEVRRMVQSVCELPVGHSAEWDAEHPQQQEADAPRVGRPGSKAAGEAAGCAEDATEPVDGPAPKWRKKNGAIMFNPLAKHVGERFRARVIDGAPALWTGRRWEFGKTAIMRVIRGVEGDATQQVRNEVYNALALDAPRVSSDTEFDGGYYASFRNATVDMMTGEVVEPTPEMYICGTLPLDFDPGADTDLADAYLTQWAAGDPDTCGALLEVIAACICSRRAVSQAPMLIGCAGGSRGKASNGKSTYINWIRSILGVENVTSLDVDTLSQHFQAGQIVGKLANLGDDIPDGYLKDAPLSVFKKLVTGDAIYSDVKYGDGFEFRPATTLVFSMNEVPRFADTSEGVYRRLAFIPFRARFAPDAAGYDPDVAKKLTAPEVMRGAALSAVLALPDLVGRGHFMAAPDMLEKLEDVKLDNDSVARWMGDELVAATWLDGKTVPFVYKAYTDWCDENGEPYPVTSRKLCARIREAELPYSITEAITEPSPNITEPVRSVMPGGLEVVSRWDSVLKKSVKAFQLTAPPSPNGAAEGVR